MKTLTVKPVKKLQGEITVPGDKSISHRAVMLGALAEGETVINNFLNSADCLATVDCLGKMGVEIGVETGSPSTGLGASNVATVKGKGLQGLSAPADTLYAGNSGTTIRLLSGILAGQSFNSKITGDASIQKRPMKRVAEPLKRMGAKIGSQVATGAGSNGELTPPLTITGSKLHGIEYMLPMASAQVKSCVLLAALFAEGQTTVIEPAKSRDHTERMMGYLGLDITVFKNEVCLRGGRSFEGREINVPGDISSAAFFMVAAALISGSDLLIRGVGVNPTRTGIIEVMHRMGAFFEVLDEEIMSGEPRADIEIRHSCPSGRRAKFDIRNLKGIEIGGELIPRLIDEIPIMAVLATQAQGDTVIKDARELRIKESDRISAISTELRKMGANIDECEDGMVIHGPTRLKGAKVMSHGDHRVAMSLAVAGLIAEGETVIEDTDCIETSFPGFEKLLSGF